MSKPKRGKVVRLSDFAWSVVEFRSDDSTKETIKKTIDLLIEELHDLTVQMEEILRAPTYFVLPDSLCKSEPEARGEAILRAVRKGKKKAEIEPVAVRVI